MADNAKTNEELQALVVEGSNVVKQASARITELETQAGEHEAEKTAHAAKVAEAKAYGPKIVDHLIKAGMVNAVDRDKCLEAMGDPVKVASQLGLVLDGIAAPSAVGAVETTDAGEKAASERENPMQNVDDTFRNLVGLS